MISSPCSMLPLTSRLTISLRSFSVSSMLSVLASSCFRPTCSASTCCRTDSKRA